MGFLRHTLTVAQERGLASVVRGGCRMFNLKVRNGFTEPHGNPEGVSVFDRDWDNLIILDACRYDYFRDMISDYDISGDLSVHRSLGSCSREFVQRNFEGRQLHEVVVVSVNWWYEQVQKDFDTPVDVHHLELINEREDRGVGKKIAFPDHIIERLGQIVEEYDDKRLLLHFHQPHAPYVGPTAKEHSNPDKYHPLGIPHKYARDAYQETLNMILSKIPETVEMLDGKTVISADHGDLLGDRGWPIPVKLYGHPCEHYHEKLTTVPWFVVDHENRRTITAEEPTKPQEFLDDSEREERLRDLGYLQ